MISVVIGGYRNFENYGVFKSFVDSCIGNEKEITILSGHCKGTDLMGERYAKEKGFSLEIYPADWKKHGRAAGPIRNKQMVEKADIVIAFTCERATGTKNLIAQAEKLNKKVFIKDIGEFICDYTKYDAVLENRTELHLHTKLSDDVSVIGVSEVFENAERLGLEGIAFTNLNNVQDFSKIANCHRKKPELKAIYGAEVRYMNEDGKAPFGLTILVKNQAGIKELYKVISSINNDGVCDLIDLTVLKQNRKNLLVGSAGNGGELFSAIAQNKPRCEVEKTALLYDYFEIYPAENDAHRAINKKIFKLGEDLGVPVVAAGNCHYFNREDKVCCDVIKRINGAACEEADVYFLRTAQEMLDEFSYLGEKNAKTAVFHNPQTIADLIESVEPLKQDFHFPCLENAYEQVENIATNEAKRIYGTPLPQQVKSRLEAELAFIQKNDFASFYLIAQKIAAHSKKMGYLVEARGTAGSSLVAFFLGICETNPLPPHYYCPECHYTAFDVPACCGFDLPAQNCPSCGALLKGQGHDMPYEMFMGYNGDKVPDFDLNVSSAAYYGIIELLKTLFGSENIAMAGTIGEYFDFSADGAIKFYEREQGVNFSDEQVAQMTEKIVGAKRSEGVHPCGVMIIPQNAEFEDFTPLKNIWAPLKFATHFDFHNLHNTILKQDILISNKLDLIKLLEDFTGKGLDDVIWNDKRIYELFTSGFTVGITDFERPFVRNLLMQTKPQNFSELVKISGLCHGTNVWTDNAELLIKSGECAISDVVANRDDVMNFLTGHGMKREDAFKFAEMVRKGLIARNRVDPETLNTFIDKMRELGVPAWFYESCRKIRYAFPKAHSTVYLMNGVRCAWFKIYYPTQFYAASLSVCEAERKVVERLCENLDEAENYLEEIKYCFGEGSEEFSKAQHLVTLLTECKGRGIKILPPSIHLSHKHLFLPENGNIRFPL